MPTTIDSAGITFNDATSLTSAVIPANAVGATQIANGSVTAAKLGTTEQKQIAKAWVNFNGTTSPGTIRSSYNVSSVTKNSTGAYTINFSNAMPDSNYTVTASSDGPTNVQHVNPYLQISLTTSIRIAYFNSNNSVLAADPTVACVQVFGN